MLKSCYKSIGLLMAYDNSYALINKICNLISFGMNSNLSLVSVSLVSIDTPW